MVYDFRASFVKRNEKIIVKVQINSKSGLMIKDKFRGYLYMLDTQPALLCSMFAYQ